MAQELVIHIGDRPRRRVPLDLKPITLGRAHTNELCFPEDASLSRSHMVFEAVGEGWRVRDLGSKNGTLVNGAQAGGGCTLRPGDQIQAGKLTIVYQDDAYPTAGAAVEFYVGPEDEGPAASSGTLMMTNLEGLLSGEVSFSSQGGPSTGADPKPAGDTVVKTLVRAGKELASDRPLAELFELILTLSIESVGAERGVLMTLEEGELLSRACVGDGFLISTTVRDKVLNEKASVLVRDTQLDKAFRDRESISEQQIRTMMAVPLQTDQRVIGLIYVDSRFFVRDFTEDDLSLLTVLANIAAIRIENTRLAVVEQKERWLQAELEQAAAIQAKILPADSPPIEGMDVAGFNVPCLTVGGDYYDFFAGPDGHVSVVLGDVAGKGMPASLLMTGLQARVRLLAELQPGLAERMGYLDRSLSVDCPSNRFITFFYGIFEEEASCLRYCNAGHNLPLVLRNDGSVEMLEGGGTVLGIFPDLGYEEYRTPMAPGEMLVLFSDGVSEALKADGSDEEYGEERLARSLEGHREKGLLELLESLRLDLDEWTGGSFHDDATLVLARFCASGE